jgi:hypothetical protein
VCISQSASQVSAGLFQHWVALVSNAPIDSGPVWVEGIAYSVVAGWLAALIVALVYNRVAVR